MTSIRQVLEWGSAETAPFEFPVMVFNKAWLGGHGAVCSGIRMSNGMWEVRGFVYENEVGIPPTHWTWMMGPRAALDTTSEPDVPLQRGGFPEQRMPS